MSRRAVLVVLVTLVAVFALALGGTASAAPDPIPFCLPDLDGHCRYCELRFDPVSIRCVGG